MIQMIKLTLAVVLMSGIFAGCETGHAHHAGDGHAHASAGGKQLVAVMHPTLGNKVSGVVTFTESKDGIVVSAKIKGLTPNGKHAIHVHEFGDATDPSGKSAGGHYNPEGHDHALPDNDVRHAGDLGNLQADGNGHASYTITVNNISLTGKNAVVGRGVIIHAKADDGGQPTGNAGPRISIGVIGFAKTK